MKPTRRTPHRFALPLALGGLVVLLSIPLAAATNLGWFGDVRSNNWTGLVFGILIVAVIVAVFHKWLKIKSVAAPAIVAIVATLVLIGGNGLFAPGSAAPGTASILGGATTTSAPVSSGSLAWDASLYEPQSAITFQAIDRASRTDVSPNVDVYVSGSATEKQAVEGSGSGSSAPVAQSLGMTSGASTTPYTWQAQVYGCSLDAHLDLSAYYEAFLNVPRDTANVNACHRVNGNANNGVTLPAFEIKKIGTFDISLGGSTLTCSAGSDCIYKLLITSSVSNTYLERVAVKVGTLTNATVTSIDGATASVCDLQLNANGSQYIVVTKNGGEIGPGETVGCNVHVSRASGSSGGSFVLTGDDFYQGYGAPAFVTNTNIRSASASSDLTVSFA